MASQTTVLTEYSRNGDLTTFAMGSHSLVDARLVTHRRRLPGPNGQVASQEISTLYGTHDPDGNLLDSKVSVTTIVRYPLNGDSADVTAALATHRDIVAGDEFGSSVTTFNYVPPSA